MIPVYLAGPEVFLEKSLRDRVFQDKIDLCTKYKCEAILPICDASFGEGLSKQEKSSLIFKDNLQKIQNSLAIIANLTPFRSPSADVGTVMEFGYGLGIDKIVIGYTNTTEKYIDRVKSDNTKVEMEIEDFDNADNLMITEALNEVYAPIITHDIPRDEWYTNMEGFEKSLIILENKIVEGWFKPIAGGLQWL